MKNLITIVMLILLSGCAVLDAQSSFEDSIEDVKRFNSYTRVTAKSYRPDMTAVKGALPTKGSLYIIAHESHRENTKTPASSIKLEVTYLKNYSEYTTFTLNGRSQKVVNELPVFETCSDLCMNIQYLQLPINSEELQSATKEGLSFTLSSSNETTVTQFNIAAGYIRAITEQFTTEDTKQSVVVVKETPVTESHSSADRAEEMVKYWFNEASETEKEQFLDWALMNRNNSETKSDSGIKAIDMTSYWYNKVQPERRKAVLAWLINQ